MIDSYREMDSALKYVSVESFARDEECFKLMCTIDLAIEARKALGSYLEEERNQVQTDCLLSSSRNAPAKRPDVLVIIPGGSPRAGYMPGSVVSKREQRGNSGRRSLTSPSMISGTTSVIGCVLLALPWKR